MQARQTMLRWHRRTRRIEPGPRPAVTEQNRGLLEHLVSITGRFLDCVSGIVAEHLEFNCELRGEAAGLVKLDIDAAHIVAAYDTRIGPLPHLMSTVEKALYVANVDPDGPIAFVPIVVFGEHDSCMFYIESMRSLRFAAPWFIDAAHRFVAHQLLPHMLGADPQRVRAYLATLHQGQDPLQLLAREPLISGILRSAPAETRAEMMRQIAIDLESRLTR